MKFIFKIIGGLALLFGLVIGYLFVFGTTDLNTDVSKNFPYSKDAKLLLEEMGNAHGIEHWENIETYTIHFEDSFFGTMGSISHPYTEDTVQMTLTYIPKTYDGIMRFLTGMRIGESWGMQSWKTYKINERFGLKFEEDSDILFWLPTYQYFIEFPLRIQKADQLAYAGEREIDGTMCDGILATWKTLSPQKDIDQYLIWIDQKDKTIVKLEYTIRDMYNFITGAVYFKEYLNFDGLILPASMPVESNLLKDGFLHEMKIINFSKNRIKPQELRPNRALAIMGDEKPKK